MTIGTKTLLFGAHQFVLHPVMVAIAWTRLYGVPYDPRLWIAFVVHDLGYVGRRDLDGPEGEAHVELGARIMARLFGPAWGDFCRYHSRFRASADGRRVSRLCLADKLAVALMPAWLYLPLARLSGEIHEYMSRVLPGGKYAAMNISCASQRAWFDSMAAYLRQWVETNREEV